MLPFPQQNTNQATPATSVPQQISGGTNNALPNLIHIQSQLGYPNPQLFGNPNSNPMNIPNFNPLQNSHLGCNSLMGSSQQFQSPSGFSPNNFNLLSNLMGQGNSTQFLGQNNSNFPLNNGQFGWQNQLQQQQLLSPLLNLNPSQVNALTQLLGCANQAAQAVNQLNAAFSGNLTAQQLGFGQPNVALQQSSFSQQQVAVPNVKLPNVSVPPSDPAVSSHPRFQSSNFQGNHGKKQGLHSSHHQNKNFMKKSNREPFNGRFQKSQDHNLYNPKGNKSSNFNEGKAGIKDGSGSSNQSNTGKKRSLALLYTEKEIQQWREERKKNYPSKANVDKKLAEKQANDDAADEAAKLRRQQLKEVLAKQAELGFEVPEIPSHYLLDSEQQPNGRDKCRTPLNKGRFQNNRRQQNRFNRGAKFDRRDQFASKRETEDDGSSKKPERRAKIQRLENGSSTKSPSSIREPTLLKKLLKSDIKRDQNRLLQAFRFMVINSFFKDYPEKPLDFPKVIVKETEVNSDVIEEKSPFSTGEVGNFEDKYISHDGDGENDGGQEEGEITD